MTKFNSHIKSLKIVIKPAMPKFEGGTKVGDVPGKYALFVDGQFETQDEEILEKLLSLPTYGVDFWKSSDEPAQEKESTVDGDLQKYTKKELQAMAEEKDIELDGSETKDSLIELLQEKKEN
jgi:hypothetical protein